MEEVKGKEPEIFLKCAEATRCPLQGAAQSRYRNVAFSALANHDYRSELKLAMRNPQRLNLIQHLASCPCVALT
jgi:hypothetical protein